MVTTYELHDAMLALMGEMKSHNELLRKLTTINSNVEETLMNVLLAIRQNEYLQAHYPAQCGAKEMMVVGTHPLAHPREIP